VDILNEKMTTGLNKADTEHNHLMNRNAFNTMEMKAEIMKNKKKMKGKKTLAE
jgi:hypothetical protein